RRLVGEVAVDQALAHAGLAGDGGHAGAVETLLRETLARGLEDPGALRLRARPGLLAAAGRHRAHRRATSRRTVTKNSGMKKMPRKVPLSMPPTTPVPIARCAPEPAPV